MGRRAQVAQLLQRQFASQQAESAIGCRDQPPGVDVLQGWRSATATAITVVPANSRLCRPTAIAAARASSE